MVRYKPVYIEQLHPSKVWGILGDQPKEVVAKWQNLPIGEFKGLLKSRHGRDSLRTMARSVMAAVPFVSLESMIDGG